MKVKTIDNKVIEVDNYTLIKKCYVQTEVANATFNIQVSEKEYDKLLKAKKNGK